MPQLRPALEPVALHTVAIIPVLNEAGAIGPTIRGLDRRAVDAVVVVDGGSTDTTVREAEEAGAEVLIEPRRGYGRACLTGVERARALGATLVLFLDGDGADPADRAADLLAPLRDGGADFVLATRTAGGGREPGSMHWHQVLAGALIGRAVGLTCGVRYTDMSAFRAIRLQALEQLHLREMTYGWNLEMQMRAARAGLRIREISLPYRRRVAGASKVAGNLRGTLRAGSRILITLFRLAREGR